MRTWNDYKNYVKAVDPASGRDLTDVEEQAAIITELIKERTAQGLSQRELAELCGIPQSSVGRIEAFQTTPNLSTLLKITRCLGLKLTITR